MPSGTEQICLAVLMLLFKRVTHLKQFLHITDALIYRSAVTGKIVAQETPAITWQQNRKTLHYLTTVALLRRGFTGIAP